MHCDTTLTGPPDLTALRRPIYGSAHLDPDGTVAVGGHADGSTARLLLRNAATGDIRHTAIVGGAVSGTTTLLRSILDAAATAAVPAQVIDCTGELRSERVAGVYPVACTFAAARRVLAEQVSLAQHQRDTGAAPQRPLTLLVINDLQLLTSEPAAAELLGPLVRLAEHAGIAIVAGTRQVTLDVFGTWQPNATRARLTTNLVLLRHPGLHHVTGPGGPLAPIPARFDDGSCTAGIGYLRHAGAMPFRAWLP